MPDVNAHQAELARRQQIPQTLTDVVASKEYQLQMDAGMMDAGKMDAGKLSHRPLINREPTNRDIMDELVALRKEVTELRAALQPTPLSAVIITNLSQPPRLNFGNYHTVQWRQ